MARRYQLCIEQYEGSTMVIYESSSIYDMDCYTKEYMGECDLISDKVGSYLGYRVFLRSKYKDKMKYLPILFSGDSYSVDSVKSLYMETLKKNRNLIDCSNVRYVNTGVLIHKNMREDDLERCVLAYFNNNPYKVIRDTYFFLVDCEVIKRDISNEVLDRTFSSYMSDSQDDFFLSLFECDDYESLYKYYDLTDMSDGDIMCLTGRVKRRSLK